MNEGRLKSILSALKQRELSFREKQFVEAVNQYFMKKGKVTEQQESILEGIYREKTRFIKNTIRHIRA